MQNASQSRPTFIKNLVIDDSKESPRTGVTLCFVWDAAHISMPNMAAKV
jgi:hypothetical protein